MAGQAAAFVAGAGGLLAGGLDGAGPEPHAQGVGVRHHVEAVQQVGLAPQAREGLLSLGKALAEGVGAAGAPPLRQEPLGAAGQGQAGAVTIMARVDAGLVHGAVRAIFGPGGEEQVGASALVEDRCRAAFQAQGAS